MEPTCSQYGAKMMPKRVPGTTQKEPTDEKREAKMASPPQEHRRDNKLSQSVEIRRKKKMNLRQIGKAILRYPFESYGILGNHWESSGIRCGEVNVSLSERSARAKRARGATQSMPSCRLSPCLVESCEALLLHRDSVNPASP